MVIHHTKDGGNCTSVAGVDILDPQSNVQTSNGILWKKYRHKVIT